MNNPPPTPTVNRPAPGDAARMGSHHLAQALKLSQALEWPYRAEDWAFALGLGRGFAVEAGGDLVGTALWWFYGSDFASAGMIIVAAQAQRQGIGARLMDALLADTAGRRIILNSTREGEALYTRLGFAPYDVVYQHQAGLAGTPATDMSVPLRPATPDDRLAVLAIDKAASGMDRTALLDAISAIADMLGGFTRRPRHGLCLCASFGGAES